MPYVVHVTPKAEGDLAKVPDTTARRILARIQSLGMNPRPHGVMKLVGRENTYRARVGNYRVLYEIRDDAGIVIVERVRHRREAY